MSMNTRKYVMIVALVLFMSSITEAQNSGVTLYASGKVNVNGMGVARSTSLLDGDVVETGADGIVSMVGGGTSVMMQNNAIVQFSKQGLNVASGSVAVKTSDGMVANVGSISIQPVNGAARYRVSQNANGVQIDVLEGSLAVADGGKSVNVNAGRSVTMACSNCGVLMTRVLQARDQNKQKFQDQQFTANNAIATHVVTATKIDPGTATVTTAGPAGKIQTDRM